LAGDAGQWLKIRVHGRPRYFGIRSESDPQHFHFVNLHTCCCQWSRRFPDIPCSHVLAVRLHVDRVRERHAQPPAQPASPSEEGIMPANISDPRTAIVMAAELSAIAEDSLSTALEALAAGEPTEADDLATRALTDLNQAVARVRDFKRLRSASPAIELPTVLQTNGGILHAWADLLTLYGVTADASLIRRISEETTLPVAVQRSVEGVTLSVRVPGSETVFDRELAYPFSRIKWSQAIFHLVAQAGQALDAVTPESAPEAEPAPAAEADEAATTAA